MKEALISTLNKIVDPLEIARLCAVAADSKKATDISIIDVGDIISVADYFVICSGSSDRQVDAIVDSILRACRDQNMKAISIEGEHQKQWVLIDFTQVVVHVFLQEIRDFYRLERLFKDANTIDWQDLDSATG